MSNWISPATAMDMIFDDPAHRGSEGDYGFGILWAKNGGKATSTTDLARAKLQPRKPTVPECNAAKDRWPVTAYDHRLVLAPGVADVSDIGRLFEEYDAAMPPGQNMRAIIQTLKFDPDLPRHAMMHQACMYVSICLQPKRLSSLVVQHVPGDSRSRRAPHVHVLTLCRAHRLSGFGEVHTMFDDSPGDMHIAFEADWQRFRGALDRIYG